LVLAGSGASLHRDEVDKRVVENCRNRRGRLINSPKEVGGWPQLTSKAAEPDSDGDGMPDSWEKLHGLDPKDGADGNRDRDEDGYTNLEEYLSALCQLR
jgi:hypothetical protein